MPTRQRNAAAAAPFLLAAAANASRGQAEQTVGRCLLQSAVARTASERVSFECEGPDCWRIWGRREVLGEDNKQCSKYTECRQFTRRCSWCASKLIAGSASMLEAENPPQLCLRDYHDIISDKVKQLGYWPDCLPLEELWTTLAPFGGVF